MCVLENFSCSELAKMGQNILLHLALDIGIRKLILTFIQRCLPSKIYDCIIFESLRFNA